MKMTKAMELSLRTKELPWNEAIWDRIDRAVHHECKRTEVASKFLPLHGPVDPNQTTVPSDTIIVSERANGERSNKLQIDEAETTKLIELVVEFVLTQQQMEAEEELGTAVTLATRAANLLCQASDVVIFQGQKAIDKGPDQHPLFRDRKVIARSGRANLGLLDAPEAPDNLNDLNNPQNPRESRHQQIVTVPSLGNGDSQRRWGENTFAAVSKAYARLQSGDGLAQAHYGPYASILNFEPYADTYAPLPTTLIMPADRIARLVTEGFYGMGYAMNGMGYGMNPSSEQGMQAKSAGTHFYGTGTLPPLRGMLVSLGGNTMDLVVGINAKTEYLTQDKEGNYFFRVYKRFTLRLKDPSAVIRLEFDQ